MSTWESRITRHGHAVVKEVVDNPRNWRVHDDYQKGVLSDIIEQVGVISQVVINERTGFLVDGHLRVDLARDRGEETIPAVFVDLSEAEENTVLLTHDTIGEMAYRDNDAYAALIETIDSEKMNLESFIGREHSGEVDESVADEEAPVETQHGAQEAKDESLIRIGEGYDFMIPLSVFTAWRDDLYEEVGFSEAEIEAALIDKLGLGAFVDGAPDSDADAVVGAVADDIADTVAVDAAVDVADTVADHVADTVADDDAAFWAGVDLDFADDDIADPPAEDFDDIDATDPRHWQQDLADDIWQLDKSPNGDFHG